MTDSQLPTVDAGDEPTRHATEQSTQIAGTTRRDARTERTRVASLDQLPPDEPGSLLLGRYRLDRRLGAGAFGLVYRARDERLDRDVAVKVLPRERVAAARFEREARAAARLQHPAIVTLYEAAVDDEGAYLVSELVKGRTLDALLDAGKLSDREIVEVGIGLCDALTHAHAHGVIHRDVKPSNVLVPNRAAAGGHRAKLTDFGVAHIVGGDALTRTGDVVGTAAYMAPEQAAGAEAGPESDLFALALVLYEALTGVNPVREAGARGPRARRAAFIPPLRRQRRELPRELGAGIDRALSPRVSDRGTVGELRASLAACLDQTDDVRGIVAPGWGGDSDGAEPRLGPEWAEPAAGAEPASERRFAGGGPQAATAALAERLPRWLPRGLSALAAGLMAGWLSAHLLPSAPVAPATAGLIAVAAVLLLPRLGWAAVVVLLAATAGGEGRMAGALALLLLTIPPLLLLALAREGAPLPAGAVALGVIGLAGAWPAVVARTGIGWWQRAVVAASGFVWLIAAGALVGQNLYWLPAHAPSGTAWLTSTHVALHRLLLPSVRTGALAGALVWGAAAALWPLILRRRWPVLDLIAVAATSALVVAAVAALGARSLHDSVLGAVLGAAVLATPALFDLGRDLRRFTAAEPPVA